MRTDPSLLESEAVLEAGGEPARVEAALGSPERPMDAAALAAKVDGLGGPRGWLRALETRGVQRRTS